MSLKNTLFFDYDHNLRTWKTTEYKDKDIIKSLSIPDKNYMNVFTSNKILDTIQNKCYFSNYMHGQLYTRARNLIFGSDSIQFNVRWLFNP